MIWVAPSGKNAVNASLGKRLWAAADQFRANSGLKSQEYFARLDSEPKRQAATPKLSPPPALEARAIEQISSEHSGAPAKALTIQGLEKTNETGRLCRLVAVRKDLEGEINHGGKINSFYDAPHDAIDLLLARLLSGQINLKSN